MSNINIKSNIKSNNKSNFKSNNKSNNESNNKNDIDMNLTKTARSQHIPKIRE